jgi:hypothetical protein
MIFILGSRQLLSFLSLSHERNIMQRKKGAILRIHEEAFITKYLDYEE